MTTSDDDIEIRNLVAHLARLADLGTVDEYLEAFTQDALFEIPGSPPSNGLQELKDRTLAQRSAEVVGPSSNSMHLLGTSAIDVDGDRAMAYTPWAVCSTTNPGITLVGRYEDELVRTINGWKVCRRTLAFG